MNVVIQVIPHKEQRYSTVGDYWIDRYEVAHIRVSEMGNWRYNFLVAVHELVELGIILHQKIPIEKIDSFDKRFEEKREIGNFDEAGDDPKAPYRMAHCVATGVERIVAAVIGVSWKKYDAAVNAL